MDQNLVCWNCGKSIADVPLPISRHATCSHCFEVLHCCRMCAEFRAKQHIHCANDLADPPSDIQMANFCEYFSPVAGTYDADNDKGDSAKVKLDALFGEGEAPATTADDDIAGKLDDLFDN